jgi:asparagine N-glycosylation enzyme membrane subunit Stt3
MRPAAPPGPSTLLVVIIILACAATSLVAGNLQGVFDGKLIDTDSYARVSRIEAMVEAGRALHHTPRDNSGLNIGLHWTHLLDGLILLLSLPLRLFFPLGESLRLAGAAIGPLSTALVALAAYQAVRLAAGSGRHAVTAAVLAALAPGVVAYGAFGRADHHIMLAAIAVLMPALAYAAGSFGRRLAPAIAAGALGGLGVWISPEALPFLLFAWGIAALRDVDAERRVGPRALALAAGHLAVLALALLVDPPASGRLALEVDRLSLPYVELGAGMLVVPLILRRFVPAAASPWLAAILAGAILAVPLIAWVVHYPGVLKGAGGIFSAEAIERVWQYVAEMRPVRSLENLGLMIALPALVLVMSVGALLWRTRTPMALLLAAFAVFLLYIGVKHVRFAMYLQLAAVVALGVVIEIVTRREDARAWRLVLIAAWLGLLVGPFALSSALPSDKSMERQGGSCDPRSLTRALEPLAGQIVLTPFSDAPEVLYFTRAIMVAGPYHRAERLIIRSLDAFDETTFAGLSMPASFAATQARAVLICTKDRVKQGTLWAALKDGRPPDWLVERLLDAKSGYRLYVLR